MSKSEERSQRRNFLRAAGTLVGVGGAAAASRREDRASAADLGPNGDIWEQPTVSMPSSLVAETTFGRVRGF